MSSPTPDPEPAAAADGGAAASTPAPLPSPTPPPTSPPPPAAQLPPSIPPIRFSNLLSFPLVDDFTSSISSLLHRFCDCGHPELEGKLGLHLSPSTSSKPLIHSVLPHLLLLDPTESHHSFHPALPARVFAHLHDDVLSKRFEAEQAQARAEHRPPRMAYTHPVTTDLFYSTSDPPTRVTLQSPHPPVSIIKAKVHHLDFLVPPLTSPQPPPPSIDFRVTLSNESPAPLPPPSAKPHRIREKDRRSYALDLWRVDCTCVKTWQAVRRVGEVGGEGGGWEGEGAAKVTYEVEVELVDAHVPRVRAEAARVKAEGRGPSPLLVDIARNLLDNLRTLARVAVSPAPPSCLPVRRVGGGEGKGAKRPREEEEVKDGR